MTGRCIALIMLTATRCKEAREATWDEIDLPKKLWIIPAHRTKGGTEHRVPLSKPAVELLKVLALYRSPTNPLIFPGRAPSHNAPSNGTLLRVMDRLGCPEVTNHGFRTTFRTWVTENGKPWEVGEASLSHKLGSKVALAYMRSDLLDLRRFH